MHSLLLPENKKKMEKSSGEQNKMIRNLIFKGHGGIFLRLDINYIYIWIVLEVLSTNIYAINYFRCVFLYRGDIEINDF